MESKNTRYKTIGFIRMQKNSSTNEYFFPVSFENGTRGVMRMNSAKVAAVKQDITLLNKQVVGTISVDTQAPNRKTSTSKFANGREATKPAVVDNNTDGLPF